MLIINLLSVLKVRLLFKIICLGDIIGIKVESIITRYNKYKFFLQNFSDKYKIYHYSFIIYDFFSCH